MLQTFYNIGATMGLSALVATIIVGCMWVGMRSIFAFYDGVVWAWRRMSAWLRGTDRV